MYRYICDAERDGGTILKTKPDHTRLSLAPLSFDEAVTDILKIKPEPKPPKKKAQAKKRPTRN